VKALDVLGGNVVAMPLSLPQLTTLHMLAEQASANETLHLLLNGWDQESALKRFHYHVLTAVILGTTMTEYL